MKVLLDLNVVWDVVLNRQPWVDESKRVWDASQAQAFQGYLVATGLTNLFYIVRRQADRDRARTAVRTCLASFEIHRRRSSSAERRGRSNRSGL